MYSKMGWVVGWLAIAILIGGGIGWLAYHQSAVPKIDLPPTTPEITATPATNVETAHVADPMASEPSATPSTEPPAEPATWQTKLDDILVTGDDVNEKADKLLDLIKATPDEGKEDVAHHLANMTQDENYSGVADLLTNATTLASVQSVLMNDLLNRNNNLKLPILLSIASDDSHPLHSEAKDMLELYIQEDKGTNWGEWRAAVDNYLKENEE
jgi:hypothetical protein